MESPVGYFLNCIYLLLLLFISPYLLIRRWRTGRYKEGLSFKFWGTIPPRESKQPCLWLHAASVGEVLQIEPVVQQWKARHSDWQVAISIVTQSGMQVAKKTYPDCYLFYAPLDFTWAIRNTLKRLKPTCLAMVELELWPNMIREVDRAGLPLFLINGRLSEKSFRGYSRIRPLISSLLQRFVSIVVQNETFRERFLGLGAAESRVHAVGSIKFDRLQSDRSHPKVNELRQAFGISEDSPLLMAGSTGEPEEEAILDAWTQLRTDYPDLPLLIAPRHPERFSEVASLISARGFSVCQRSVPETLVDSKDSTPKVFLLDTLGELSTCWGLATIAFVGGSLNQRGGQNMMEPAAYGAAVILGPNTWNFKEIVAELKDRDACRIIFEAGEMESAIRQLFEHPEEQTRLGKAAQEYVLSQQGATARTIEILEAGLDSRSDSTQMARFSA